MVRCLQADDIPNLMACQGRLTELRAPGLSQSYAPLSSEIPINAAARRHDAGYLLPKLLLQRRPPGHELESHPIIDHGEAARGQGDALAIDAGDVLAPRWTADARGLFPPIAWKRRLRAPGDEAC